MHAFWISEHPINDLMLSPPVYATYGKRRVVLLAGYPSSHNGQLPELPELHHRRNGVPFKARLGATARLHARLDE